MKIISLFYFVILMCRSKLEYAEASAETGDIYASTAQIRMLLLTQTRVIQRIQDYVNKEKIRLETIKGFLKNTRKEHRKALMDVSQYLDNPINAFRLIRRLTSDLEKLEAYMPARVTVYRKNQTLDVYYPDPGEMAEAAYGLVRLQMIYKLQASDLANGILKGTFSKSGRQFIERVRPLTSSDCFFLGHVSYKDLGVFIAESPRFDTKRKLRWMLEAHKKFIQENCTFCPVEELEIIDHISTRYEDLGDLKNSILWIQKRIAAKPDDPKRKLFAEIMKGMQKTLITARFPENKPEVNETLGNGRGDSNSKPPKSSICYTKPGIPSKLDHRLSCYFAHGPHPFLRLARLKAEQMHINPNITLYYEVLSESRMRSLKEASGVLTRARVADKTKPNYRIAKDMNYNNNVENEWISKQIIQITNMNMPLDAPVEVLNYGIGGHYASHYDFFGDKILDIQEADFMNLGDRPVTIIYYISEVEQGGATAFRKLGVLLYPVKGAALVWENLHPSGDGIDSTVHESCPVLRGSKWIVVKWLREGDQTHCPIWRTKDGLMTQEKYLQSNIRQEFRDKRFEKVAS